MKALSALTVGGQTFLPLVEGGKGVSTTNHASAGAWAKAGGLGTVSAVNADSYDENGDVIPQTYSGRTRELRHEELVQSGIDGAVEQVRRDDIDFLLAVEHRHEDRCQVAIGKQPSTCEEG